MRTKTKTTPKNGKSEMSSDGASNAVDWEVRPGGMLVQKRNPDSEGASVPAPTIKVRVKHGSSTHEVHISSQATFGKISNLCRRYVLISLHEDICDSVSLISVSIAGELKKVLTPQTGLHHQDQKLIFKDKERSSNAYLDMAGVKDRSKIVLVEDPTSQERRYIEMRKNAKMEKATKSISEISLEVDKLAGQVYAIANFANKQDSVSVSYN